MNLDQRTGRSWRRSRKKGVSPIIATILLVAITVVLAAVLYVLISGLTKGPGATPLGSAFNWGTVSTTTGTATSAGCALNHVCYVLDINTATSGLTGGSLSFQARNSQNQIVPFSYVITLVTVAGLKGNATWAGGAAPCVNGGGTAATCSTQLASAMALVIDTAQTTVSPLSGDTMNAVGSGSFSGSVASGVLS